MKKIILFQIKILLLCTFPLITLAQSDTNLNFPISGVFMVEPNESNPSSRYNILEFKENVFYLKMDEKELFSFKTIGLEGDLYLIQQLTYGDKVLDKNSDGPTTFKLKMEVENATTHRISFVFPNRTDDIQITKK